MNMSVDLPKPIADYVEANARLDIDGMLKPFLNNAVFIDNGKHFEGQAAIRQLFEHEVIPVKAIFMPDTVREEGVRSSSRDLPMATSRAARSASLIGSHWCKAPSRRWRPRYEHQGRSH
ncbi:hypothetical protein ACFSYD_16800 [Paracoccus aerius]